MARTSTYLNFARHTEEAFLFYKKVFGTEFSGPPQRLGEVPLMEGQPQIAESDQRLIMHIELPILGGHVLMGTDAPESMGFTLHSGNNVYLNLEPDTLAEGERLFQVLSEGGQVKEALQKRFWGAWYGSLTDRFGIHWMVNCPVEG
ncbi:MAG: VOC family protein [Spirochaetales bacterium]|nr:VOC family protein [Spirochaetales bacterium]